MRNKSQGKGLIEQITFKSPVIFIVFNVLNRLKWRRNMLVFQSNENREIFLCQLLLNEDFPVLSLYTVRWISEWVHLELLSRVTFSLSINLFARKLCRFNKHAHVRQFEQFDPLLCRNQRTDNKWKVASAMEALKQTYSAECKSRIRISQTKEVPQVFE